MNANWDTLFNQGREQTERKEANAHAALARAEGRGEGPRHYSPFCRSSFSISLSYTPVVERTCAYDNTMRTNDTDDGPGHSLVTLVTPGVTRKVTRKSHDCGGAGRLVTLVTPILGKVYGRSVRTHAHPGALRRSTFTSNGVTTQTRRFSPTPYGDYLVTPRGNERGNEPISLPHGGGRR